MSSSSAENGGTAGTGTSSSAGQAGSMISMPSGGTTSSGGGSGNTGGAPATGGTSAACPDEALGLSPSATNPVTTAVVLIDDVVIQDSFMSKTLFQWQFGDATTIADTNTDPRPGDKWSRTALFSDTNKVSRAPGAHSAFLACDGNPAAGSLKNIIPFSAPNQYYEVSVLFAAHDYSGSQITAKVMLVGGGASDAACPAHALLYGIDSVSSKETPDSPITLVQGKWLDVALTVPPTDFSHLDELGIRITTYSCQ
ncbi:MAG TPA: hypothetical protein VNW92_11595 [Polyangiaceae bacterium]|nr:hypothetical protein [Polyangiaceae bacterium]